MGNHSLLSPSSLKDDLMCPARVKYKREGKWIDRESSYAREGTEAHDLAATWLSQLTLGLEEPPTSELPADVVQAVEGYVEYCFQGRATNFGIEERIESLKVKDFGGTIDFWRFDASRGVLEIVDLKMGKGVRVTAEENTQLLSYLCLLREKLDARGILYKGTIIQPRVEDAEPTSHEWSDTELDNHLLEISMLEARSGEHQVGDCCRWCGAKLACPAFKEAMAKTEEASLGVRMGSVPNLKYFLDIAPTVSHFLKELNDLAVQTVLHGSPIKDYKLVRTVKNRCWKYSEDDLLKKLQQKFRIGKKIATEPKLRSPAQLQSQVDVDLSELWHRPPGGYKVVPQSDKREEFSPEIDIFDEEVT